MNTDRTPPSRRWRLRRGAGVSAPAARLPGPQVRRGGVRAAAPYLLVLTVLSLVAVTGWVVLGTGVLGVREVRVEGARTLSRTDVAAATEIVRDTPLARLDLGAVAARVRELPPVAQVRVRRSWPHTVVVEVVERTAAVAVPRGDGFLLVDATGVAFRVVPERPVGLLPVELAKPGPADRATRAAITVVRQLPAALRAKVVLVAAPTAEQVELRLAGGRVVFWGDAADGGRKATVATALLTRKGKRIDVSAPGVATVR